MNILRRLITVIALMCFISSVAYSISMNNFVVHGNINISKDTIKNYFDGTSGVNDTMQSQIDAFVKRLYSTGFFSDIKVYQDTSGKVVVRVVENPMVHNIIFEGNSNFSRKDILKEIPLAKMSFYSLTKLQNSVKIISDVYRKKGYFLPKINPKISKISSNRVDVLFLIDEGPKAKINKIAFIGNNAFSTKDLTQQMISREYALWRFFSKTDLFDSERINFDRDLLKKFYLNSGYADVQIDYAANEVSLKKDAFIVNFIINEGELYEFGKISVENTIGAVKKEELLRLVQIKSGDKFRQYMLDDTVELMTHYLGNKGYAFTDIPFVLNKRKVDGKSIADVKFIVKKAPKVYINKIIISGNSRTKDEVIRRQLRIEEGDPFNTSRIMRSRERLERLGYFKKVEFDYVKTSAPDKMDLTIKVEEMPTGSLMFQISYDTGHSGVGGKVGVVENNFLGKGQIVEASVSKNRDTSVLSFGMTEPNFRDKNLVAGFEVFAAKSKLGRTSGRRDNEDAQSTESAPASRFYLEESYGLVLKLGYELSEYWSHSLRYGISSERVYGFSDSTSELIKHYSGKFITSYVGHTLTYDTTDSLTHPTNGLIMKFNQDLAGLGGNIRYLKNNITASWYKPIYKEVIFNLQGKFGTILGLGKNIRPKDNFYPIVRGFDEESVGCYDAGALEFLGGKTFYAATAEVIFPSGLPKEAGVNLFGFTDYGTAYGVDIPDKLKAENLRIFSEKKDRASYGFGVIWHSPMGLVKVYYGIPFAKTNYDDTRRFGLNMGTMF